VCGNGRQGEGTGDQGDTEQHDLLPFVMVRSRIGSVASSGSAQ
jgi:hypothetical protein